MDNLAMDAKKATEAGLSYGQWKARQPVVHKLPRKIPKGYHVKVCENCGVEFLTTFQQRQRFCGDACREKASERRYREKRKIKEG